MDLVLIRGDNTKEETLGKLSIDGQFFSYTLELPEAQDGETKEDGEDRGVIICIPRSNQLNNLDKYKVKVTWSPHMQKNLPLIYTDDETLQILSPMGSWAGVRLHGGNTYLDSLGCVLVAAHEYENEPSGFIAPDGHIIENWIQGSLSQELTERLDNGQIHNLTIQ